MKIEKINDNQIRCTLTRDDLAQRQLKLSELAYGSEKAKSLFREMMQQAASEFGFESDNLPLMIEAIPTAGDSIVLNITKVDDPDELDTRFSRFTPTPSDEAADKHKSVLEHLKKLDGAEDFLDILRQMKEAVSQLPENPEALAILADLGSAAGAAELMDHQLLAVADAEDGQTQLENGVVERGGVRLKHRRGTAGEDDGGGVKGADVVHRHGVGLDLTVDAAFTHAARDEQIVLPAEIQYQYLFHLSRPHGRECRSRLPAR